MRPLLVPTALRPSAPARPRRAGILAPLGIAVALAVAGHEVSTPAADAPAAPRVERAAFAVASGVDLADFSPVRSLVGSAATSAETGVELAAPAAPKPAVKAVQAKPKRIAKRASRSAPRRAIVRPGWVRPSTGPLTSGYGPRWGRMHRGLDFGAPYGSPIVAAASGRVSFAGPQGGYGRLVTIAHADGITTAYGHMSKILVRQGERVSAGQVIALVGSEGRSTGPHLHFEVRRGSAYLNPLPFLRARKVWI